MEQPCPVFQKWITSYDNLLMFFFSLLTGHLHLVTIKLVLFYLLYLLSKPPLLPETNHAMCHDLTVLHVNCKFKALLYSNRNNNNRKNKPKKGIKMDADSQFTVEMFGFGVIKFDGGCFVCAGRKGRADAWCSR